MTAGTESAAIIHIHTTRRRCPRRGRGRVPDDAPVLPLVVVVVVTLLLVVLTVTMLRSLLCVFMLPLEPFLSPLSLSIEKAMVGWREEETTHACMHDGGDVRCKTMDSSALRCGAAGRYLPERGGAAAACE